MRERERQAGDPIGTCLSDIVSISRPICSTGTSKLLTASNAYISRRGKAPPVDSFMAEDVKTTFDDWLLTLERAAMWNDWTPEESLM